MENGLCLTFERLGSIDLLYFIDLLSVIPARAYILMARVLFMMTECLPRVTSDISNRLAFFHRECLAENAFGFATSRFVEAL